MERAWKIGTPLLALAVATLLVIGLLGGASSNSSATAVGCRNGHGWTGNVGNDHLTVSAPSICGIGLV